MPLIPRLPAGYHAQPAFHHQTDGVAFDFFRAYDSERGHDELRSFWLMTENPDARGVMPPRARWVGFADWARANHRSAGDYHVFANPQTKMVDVRRWVEAGAQGDLVDVQEP
jgi:hypothetical protein